VFGNLAGRPDPIGPSAVRTPVKLADEDTKVGPRATVQSDPAALGLLGEQHVRRLLES
jgi:hypothetical protein